MLKEGDLVRMKLGWSGVGIVQKTMSSHPRCDETGFATIREALLEPHAKVFWTDASASEIVKLSSLQNLE